MKPSRRSLISLVHRFLRDEMLTHTAHRLEEETGLFFDVKHVTSLGLHGRWDELERYVSAFTGICDNSASLKTFFAIRRQRYLEALDRGERSEAFQHLLQDLEALRSTNNGEVILKELMSILSLRNYRENEKLSKCESVEKGREGMVEEVKKLAAANPLLKSKLQLPMHVPLLNLLLFQRRSKSAEANPLLKIGKQKLGGRKTPSIYLQRRKVPSLRSLVLHGYRSFSRRRRRPRKPAAAPSSRRPANAALPQISSSSSSSSSQCLAEAGPSSRAPPTPHARSTDKPSNSGPSVELIAEAARRPPPRRPTTPNPLYSPGIFPIPGSQPYPYGAVHTVSGSPYPLPPPQPLGVLPNAAAPLPFAPCAYVPPPPDLLPTASATAFAPHAFVTRHAGVPAASVAAQLAKPPSASCLEKSAVDTHMNASRRAVVPATSVAAQVAKPPSTLCVEKSVSDSHKTASLKAESSLQASVVAQQAKPSPMLSPTVSKVSQCERSSLKVVANRSTEETREYEPGPSSKRPHNAKANKSGDGQNYGPVSTINKQNPETRGTACISRPSQCHSLSLPDNQEATKICQLMYSIRGSFILALTSNGSHKVWKWSKSAHNDASKELWLLQPEQLDIQMNNELSDPPLAYPTHCFALTKNNSYVLSSSGGKLSLYNTIKFKEMKKYMSSQQAVTCIAFNPEDSNLAAIGLENSSILVHNFQLDRTIIKLRGHRKRVTGLAFSDRLNILVSSGADYMLTTWSSTDYHEINNKDLEPPSRCELARFNEGQVQFHCNQRHFLVVLASELAVYDASELNLLSKWEPTDCLITNATYSCDSELVYASFVDGRVGVLTTKTNLHFRCWIYPTAYLSCKLSSRLFPVAIAVHPSKPDQLALALSNGCVCIIEPHEIDELGATNLLENVAPETSSKLARPRESGIMPNARRSASGDVIIPENSKLEGNSSKRPREENLVEKYPCSTEPAGRPPLPKKVRSDESVAVR